MTGSKLELRTGAPEAWPIETKPYEPGYCHRQLPSEAISTAHSTSLFRSLTAAAIDYTLVLLAVTTAILAFRWTPIWLAALISPITLLVVARSQRGLECLVHEASHYNWSRAEGTNDTLADLVAAMPMFSRVKTYRRSHLMHHARFGTSADPDLQRYRQLDLEGMDRCTRVTYAYAIASRMIPYAIGWWRAIGTDRRGLAHSLAWYLCLFGGTALLLEPATAAQAWLIWWTAFVLVLPVLRLIGESSEHVYMGTTSVFDATISNTGTLQRLLIHPHADAFHTLHHLWPRVPHHQLERFHRLLSRRDMARYGILLRQRRRLRERPTLSQHERHMLTRSGHSSPWVEGLGLAGASNTSAATTAPATTRTTSDQTETAGAAQWT